jgi:hypothetical protein
MPRSTPLKISKDENGFSNLEDISSAPQATELKNNIDELEKNFNELHLDIIFFTSKIPDYLSTNQYYMKLTELSSNTKKKKEEITRLKISFLGLFDFSDKVIILGEQITRLKKLILGPQNDDVKIEENSIPTLEYLRLLDESVRNYQAYLYKYQKNFTELNQEIEIIKIEASKMTGKNIGSLTSLKSDEYQDDIESINHISHEILEKYFLEFFNKIEISKEKLNNLKSELEDFCQQQLYPDLTESDNIDSNKIQQKMNLAIKIKDCQCKILQNLVNVHLYETQFFELVSTKEFPSGLDESNLMQIDMSSFCIELEGFINSNSVDKFNTELQSLSSPNDYAIEISTDPRSTLLPILEETISTLTTSSQEIEAVNPKQLFQEVLKNLLDEEQQNTNSIIVLGQEVSRNCSLFDKLKCFSLKGVDEDEQPTISYFLIKNKLVKLIYNPQDLIISSEPNSDNLTHRGEDQFTKFSSEEILEKLAELEKIKLQSTESLQSTEGSLQDLSQSFLNKLEINIFENTNLHQDRSIPKSIKKEVDKLLKSTPGIMASLTFDSPHPEAEIKMIKTLSSNHRSMEVSL